MSLRTLRSHLSFEVACGDAFDELLLADEEQQHARHRNKQDSGHQQRLVDFELFLKNRQPKLHRAHVFGAGEDERLEQIIP